MSYERNDRKQESVYSKKVKAGKRRTYFFDVKSTRSNDYFLIITESKKRFEDGGYDRHQLFVYKEDFNKFVKALSETVDHIKTDLMPDFNFDIFNHEYNDSETDDSYKTTPQVVEVAELNTVENALPEVEKTITHSIEQDDKW